MSDKIVELLAEAAKISERALRLARRGDVEAALRLESQADLLRTRAREERPVQGLLPARSRDKPSGSRRGDQVEGTRGLTISSLVEIGVPASPRAVAEYASLRFGKTIDPRALASLRRDELRAWSSPNSARAIYVVPALEGMRFFPVRGKVALSDWHLRRRIMGPWSERVDHLTATRNLARQLAWLSASDPQAGERLIRLVASYASTVPGAIVHDGNVDPRRIEQAVGAELAVIGPKDEEWRGEAAERAAHTLGDAEKLWGSRPPGLATGASA
jgi:hypothetical protein